MKNIVVITGVAQGIGRATVHAFKKAGWNVIGIDKSFSKVSDNIDRFIRTDLSNLEAVEKILNQLVSEEREIQAIVNNAAVQLVKPLVETEPEEWETLMAVNVRAAYLMTKYLFPLMRSKGGSIINIASVHAIATSKGLAAYATSKGALVAMTRATALELAEYDIRVNAILPGAIDTDMLRAGLIREVENVDTDLTSFRDFSLKQPMGRIGKPEEIASAILFLTDEKKSAFITGQTLVIDGGALARLSTE